MLVFIVIVNSNSFLGGGVNTFSKIIHIVLSKLLSIDFCNFLHIIDLISLFLVFSSKTSKKSYVCPFYESQLSSHYYNMD